MSAFTPAQRQQAIGLYKRLLRTSRDVFANDATVQSAWRLKVRDEFTQARLQSDASTIDEGLRKWEDVNTVLRQNVVQGVLNEKTEAFRLHFRADTEMGSNESIKAQRQKQMDDLRASKGVLKCGSGGISSTASTSSVAGARGFATWSIRQKDKIHNIKARSKLYDPDWVSKMPSVRERTLSLTDDDADPLARNPFAGKLVQDPTWESGPLPRPVPHFGQVAIQADGSTIQLFTASPRGMLKLTRDPTNHPVWNPRVERGRASGEEEGSERMMRFRKRFGASDEVVAPASDAEAGGKPKPAGHARSQFNEDDFGWMEVGGRENLGKLLTPPAKKAGSGKKK